MQLCAASLLHCQTSYYQFKHKLLSALKCRHARFARDEVVGAA